MKLSRTDKFNIVNMVLWFGVIVIAIINIGCSSNKIDYVDVYVSTRQNQACYLYDRHNELLSATITPLGYLWHTDTVQIGNGEMLKAEFSISNGYPTAINYTASNGLEIKY